MFIARPHRIERQRKWPAGWFRHTTSCWRDGTQLRERATPRDTTYVSGWLSLHAFRKNLHIMSFMLYLSKNITDEVLNTHKKLFQFNKLKMYFTNMKDTFIKCLNVEFTCAMYLNHDLRIGKVQHTNDVQCYFSVLLIIQI